MAARSRTVTGERITPRIPGKKNTIASRMMLYRLSAR